MQIARKILLTLTLPLLFLAPSWSGLSAAAGAADPSREIYLRCKDQLFQVRLVDSASGAKASIGSGFLVSPDGHVVTNFHVVAGLINRPGQYRAEYVLADETSGPLTLLDVDVVHDLAVLRTERFSRGFLPIEKALPANGERLFSLGNPFDLGMTVVEGTFNGLIEKSLYEKIHFTGSINPGMSGGPAVNRAGRVVGVNVSSAGEQVSFLVPAKYVQHLLARLPAGERSSAELLQTVRDQLLVNQGTYLKKLLAAPFPPEKMDRLSLPGPLAPYLKCWGNTQTREDWLYEKTFRACSTSDDIFLSPALSTGSIGFRHEWIRTKGMGALRFYGFLQDHFQASHFSWTGEKEDVTEFQCHSGFVDHNGLHSKVLFCLRGYRKLEGLFDLYLAANTLAENREALYTALDLKGVSYENAMVFSRTYLEAIAWSR